MQFANPAAEHEPLERFVGEWIMTMTLYMAGPAGPSVQAKGTAVARWILGGRFVHSEWRMSVMDSPYEALSITGFDRGKNLYTTVAVNSMDTQMATARGTWDSASRTFTFYGDLDEPSLGVHGRAVKTLIRFESDDRYSLEVIDLHAGESYRVVEIAFQRKQEAR